MIKRINGYICYTYVIIPVTIISPLAGIGAPLTRVLRSALWRAHLGSSDLIPRPSPVGFIVDPIHCGISELTLTLSLYRDCCYKPLYLHAKNTFAGRIMPF